jgi:hypothetical protein
MVKLVGSLILVKDVFHLYWCLSAREGERICPMTRGQASVVDMSSGTLCMMFCTAARYSLLVFSATLRPRSSCAEGTPRIFFKKRIAQVSLEGRPPRKVLRMVFHVL